MAKKHFKGAQAPVVPRMRATSFPQYAGLSITARYLMAQAENAGLTVSRADDDWVLSGTVEQQRASGIWAVSQCWTFTRYRKAWTPLLQAMLSRDCTDPNIIHAAIGCFHDLRADARVLGPLADRAKADSGHRAFMARTLAAVDISGDEVPEPSPAPDCRCERGDAKADETRSENRVVLQYLLEQNAKGALGALFVCVDDKASAEPRAYWTDKERGLYLVARAAHWIKSDLDDGEGDAA